MGGALDSRAAGIYSVDMPSTMPRISALILGLSLATGCSKSSPDTAAPDDGSAEYDDASASHDADSKPMRVIGVYLDPALTAICELDGYDELVELDAETRSRESDQILHVVADCVKSGALQGRRIELVGHAPRSDEFVRSFGRSRADAVKEILLQDGLKQDDLVTHASDPEDDPDAASTWPTARRVDVRVATRHAK